MTKYVSIKSALRFIPKPLFQQSTELDFLSWMLDAYRELDLPATLESKVQIFEIVDGKLELPEEIKTINCVSWQQSNPTEKDKSDYIESISTIDTVETTEVTTTNTVIPTTVFNGSPTNTLGNSIIPAVPTVSNCNVTIFKCPVSNVSTKLNSVKLNINKTIINSLDIYLKSPQHEVISISSFALSGSSNFTETVFKDGFPLPFPTSSGPYTGTFGPAGIASSTCASMPVATYATFDSMSAGQNGDWELYINTEFDDDDPGEMISWELTFETPEPTTVTTTVSTVVSTSQTEPNLYPIYYKQFLNSTYFKNHYTPLLYKGNNSDLLCPSCPNKYSNCQNVFSIDKNRILHTNINSGYLCIEYDTEMLDEEGNFLIIDLTEIKRYLAYYAEALHWRERAAVKEQSAANMAQDALTKAELYFKKSRGILLLSGINPQNVAAAQSDGYQKYLKMPERYVYSR